MAARVDPYRFALRLLRRMQRQGTRVYDRTQVKFITATARSVELITACGLSIRAGRAVIANGYEAQSWLRQRVAQNRSSYAYISDPVDRKAATLQRKVARLLPHLQARPAFAWAGTFAETRDGLPLFGRHPQYGSRVLFALAYGGNGITYSMLGAGLLRAQIERRRHPSASLFSLARLA